MDDRPAQTKDRDRRPRRAKKRSVKGATSKDRAGRRRRQLEDAFASAEERAAHGPAPSAKKRRARPTEPKRVVRPAKVPDPVAAVTQDASPVTESGTPAARMSSLVELLRAPTFGAGRGRTVSTVLKDVGDQPAPLPMRTRAAATIGVEASALDGLTVLEVQAIVAAIRAGSDGEWWDRVHDRLDPKKRRVEHTGADGGAIRAELTLKREVSDKDAADVYRSLLDGGVAAIEDAELVEPASAPAEPASS